MWDLMHRNHIISEGQWQYLAPWIRLKLSPNTTYTGKIIEKIYFLKITLVVHSVC